MPASQVHTDNGADTTTDAASDIASEQVLEAGEGVELGEPSGPTVHDYLEMALEAAAEQQMSTSELMGIFFYYAHNIAESYRQDVLREHEDVSG